MLVIKPPILFLCWEYEGFNNPQTTALVRRPRYFAEALVKEGYDVTVIFSAKQQTDKEIVYDSGGRLRLISVPEVTQLTSSIPLINKFYTFYNVLRFGDFSGQWHSLVEDKLNELKLHFQIVVAFFTPRGPLYTSYKLKEKYDFKLIMDFQDPYYEGLGKKLSRLILKRSFRRVVRSADAISCVNKSWAREIENDFGVKANYIPHVIEQKLEQPSSWVGREPGRIVFFYSGSIDIDLQKPSLFFSNLNSLLDSGIFREIEFRYAGNKMRDDFFRNQLPEGVKYKFLGWLGKEDLYKEINSADIICVFPVVVEDYKTFVPSKFYEFCRFHRPILIIGDDTGAFRNELGEAFDQTYVIRDHNRFIKLMEDYSKGKSDGLFWAEDSFIAQHSLDYAYKLFKKELGC